ncbi:MAG: helix-turn-helix transcriptional regulator [Erythrobacter sp.]|jgi:DNA-binding CsgD family transcriptional regulator
MKNLAAEKLSEKSEAVAGSANNRIVPTRASNDLAGDCEALLSCWEALDGRARLILSRNGKLIAGSEGARKLFSQNDFIAFNSTFTLACSTPSNGQLQHILATAVGAVETIILPKHSADGHYVVSATGIAADTIAVAVRDADGEFVTVLADLEEAFGLTPCEVMVVEKLMRGHVPQHIADDLTISVHTVRAHLRHCYEKLQVSSREELWQRLAPYRLN